MAILPTSVDSESVCEYQIPVIQLKNMRSCDQMVVPYGGTSWWLSIG